MLSTGSEPTFAAYSQAELKLATDFPEKVHRRLYGTEFRPHRRHQRLQARLWGLILRLLRWSQFPDGAYPRSNPDKAHFPGESCAKPSSLQALLANGQRPLFWNQQTLGKSGHSQGEQAMRSEREKMLAGELYDALDPELVAARNRGRDLCQMLNASREGDQELRRFICTELFGDAGQSVWMQPPFYCDYGSNIELGDRVFFNFNCIVLDVCRVTIGDYTMFGPAVQILTPMHPLNAELRRKQEYGKPIEIGSDVWVGGGALILPGVRIGSRSVIGAGSVVTRDIPDGVFAAGNPCRVIRELADNEDDGL